MAKGNCRAVSIIEILIIIAIVGAISAISIPSYKKYTLRVKSQSILKETIVDQASILSQFTDLGTLENLSYDSSTRGTPINNPNINEITVTNGEIIVSANPDQFGGVALEITLTPVINQASGSIDWLCSTDPANFDLVPAECQNDVNSRPTTCNGGVYDGGTCTCPSGQYLQSGFCQACNYGQTWNGSACTCPTGQSLTNGQCACPSGVWTGSSCQSQCLPGQVLDGSNCICTGGRTVINNSCQCASGNWDGSTCVISGGGANRVWNTETQEFECTEGTWDGSQCATSYSLEAWNDDVQEYECTGGSTYNGSACVCPNHLPHNDNGTCRACYGGETWDGSNCSCPTGTGSITSSMSDGQTCECDGGATGSAGSCVCPTDSTWDGSQCDCNSNMELEGGTCVCPSTSGTGEESQWDSNSSTCVCYGGATGSAGSCACPTYGSITSSWSSGKCNCDGGATGDPENAVDCACAYYQSWNSGSCDNTCTTSQEYNSDTQACDNIDIPTPAYGTRRDRDIYFTLSINGGGNVATVAAGSTVNVSMVWTWDYTHVPEQNCPSCVFQVYYGIKDVKTYCLYSGSMSPGNTGGGTKNNSFTAPTTPGLYYFGKSIATNYSCSPDRNTGTSNMSDAVGALIVE